MRPSDSLFADTERANKPGSVLRLLLVLTAAFAIIGLLFGAGDFAGRWFTYGTERRVATYGAPIDVRTIARDMAISAMYMLPVRDLSPLLHTGLPTYDLRIRGKDMATVHAIADLVSARGDSIGIERPDINAELCLDGEWLPVEFKLRGQMADHYNKQHFSLRLKMPRNRYLDGQRELNLLEPYDKGLVVDSTTHWELARQGLLTLADDFAIVRLNGRVVGLFQRWQHFDRSVADHNSRPEGTIFTGAGRAYGKPGPATDKARAAMAKVALCGSRQDPNAADSCGWTFVESYFDTDRWARAAAMTTLLHSAHAWADANLRLFWDPALGRFEPIPWDYSAARRPSEAHEPESGHKQPLRDLLLDQGAFRALRDKHLWQLLSHRVEPMLAHARALFERLEPVLEVDLRHPDVALDRQRLAEYESALRANAADLKTLLKKTDLRLIWAKEAGQMRRLRVENHAHAAVLIDESSIGRESSTDAGDERPDGWAGTLVPGAWGGRPGSLVIELPAASRRSGPTPLMARNAATGQVIAAASMTVAEGNVSAPAEATRTQLVRGPLPPGIRASEGLIEIGPGSARIERTLDLPRGHTITIHPGTTLEMGAGAALIGYSDLNAVGTAEAPIVIRGITPQTLWGGLAILGRRDRPAQVRLRHVTVTGGVGTQNERVHFTAPLAVHAGHVEMVECTMKNGLADDGINLKHARVDIRQSRFMDSKDDAFDCDFCTGQFVDNLVQDSGGDGFDFSGSRVEARGNRVERCADKGFSIGEGTHANLHASVVRHCTTGVAAKDRSRALVHGARFEHLQVGIAQYVKKQTFGPSTVEQRDVEMNHVQTAHMKDVQTASNALGVCPQAGTTTRQPPQGTP